MFHRFNHHLPFEKAICASRKLRFTWRQVPKPFNPEKEFQKRQLRIREKVAAMQKAPLPMSLP